MGEVGLVGGGGLEGRGLSLEAVVEVEEDLVGWVLAGDLEVVWVVRELEGCGC